LLLAAAAAWIGGCGDHPVPPWVDPCGAACVAGEVCLAGSCQPDSACTAPFTVCTYSNDAMGCTDLRDDPYNCGSCGLRCLDGACLGGVCRSASNSCASAGLSDCQDAGGNAYCAYLGGDALDCGACGNACSLAAGEHCAAGTCQAAGTVCSDLGLAECPSGCADLPNDPYNCGQCGNVCMFGCDGSGSCR